MTRPRPAPAKAAPAVEFQLERAWKQHPKGRRCERLEHGHRVCPWPLDPALGPDAVYHPWCAPNTQRELAASRLNDARRTAAEARARGLAADTTTAAA